MPKPHFKFKSHKSKKSKKSQKPKTQIDSTTYIEGVSPIEPVRDRHIDSEVLRKHFSFQRSYKEDYIKEDRLPGLLAHALNSAKVVWQHKKILGKLLLFIFIVNVVFVGLMSEETYTTFQQMLDENASYQNFEISGIARSGLLLLSTVTTGGLAQTPTDSQTMFLGLIFITTWLITVYILRFHRTNVKPSLKNQDKLIKSEVPGLYFRDALYKALAPLISTIAVGIVLILESLPAVFAIIIYSSALQTNLLATPFYALIFFIFAGLLIMVSIYLVSGSLLGLVATSVAGVYPFAALKAVRSAISGYRLKVVTRFLFLVLFCAIFWTIIMLPFISIDIWLKSNLTFLAGVPIIPIILNLIIIITDIYDSTYIY